MWIRISQILPVCDCRLDGAEIGVGLQHFLQREEQPLPILNDYLQKIL
jgi:hypothetical protein